jgi:hypothetical protein
VIVRDEGDALIEKSSGGGGGPPTAALNSATPADQYIVDAKLAEKVCAAAAPSARRPARTLTIDGLVVVCCAPAVYPGDVTDIA